MGGSLVFKVSLANVDVLMFVVFLLHIVVISIIKCIAKWCCILCSNVICQICTLSHLVFCVCLYGHYFRFSQSSCGSTHKVYFHIFELHMLQVGVRVPLKSLNHLLMHKVAYIDVVLYVFTTNFLCIFHALTNFGESVSLQ